MIDAAVMVAAHAKCQPLEAEPIRVGPVAPSEPAGGYARAPETGGTPSTGARPPAIQRSTR